MMAMAQFPTNNYLIYVVDDDKAIARLLSINLEARGYQVKEFGSGLQAVSSLETDDPHLVILDIMMPGPDGLEITRRIRQISQVPILILSVLDETASKLTALDLGADDYLTKPFRIEELLARTRAILRRTAQATKDESVPSTWDYRSGELYVDLNGLRVVSHGRSKQLTPREWALLRVFIKYAGQVVAPRTLLKEAWGPDYGDEGDYVRTYVNRLRRKIEPEPNQPRYLLLERGLGYRLVEPA
jgi:two-component system KDP operon response regulator KdpE